MRRRVVLCGLAGGAVLVAGALARAQPEPRLGLESGPGSALHSDARRASGWLAVATVAAGGGPISVRVLDGGRPGRLVAEVAQGGPPRSLAVAASPAALRGLAAAEREGSLWGRFAGRPFMATISPHDAGALGTIILGGEQAGYEVATGGLAPPAGLAAPVAALVAAVAAAAIVAGPDEVAGGTLEVEAPGGWVDVQIGGDGGDDGAGPGGPAGEGGEA